MTAQSSHASTRIASLALRPEHQLLLCCATTRINFEVAQEILRLTRSGLDWDFLFLAASQHGLLGLLHSQLENICPHSAPDWALEFLSDCARRTAQRNRYLAEELLRILRRFQDQHIAAVPFAGPILAAAAYGNNLSLRESKSLSFLISSKQAMEGREILLADGYRREYTWDRHREAAEWRFLRTIGFDREDGVHVWLYRELDPGCFSPSLNRESVQDTVELFSVSGETVASLSAVDLLLHICVETAESALSPRLWRIVDIARLLDQRTGMDWGRLVQRARLVGAQRRLGIGVVLARDLLGAKIPEALEPLAASDQTAEALAAQSANRLFSERDVVPNMRARLAARVKSRERPQDKIRMLINLITPTRDDWALLPLPAPLYFLWKPIRVLAKRAHLVSIRHLAVFMPTPIEVAEEMLNLAEVGPEDTVFDLGCGDGRIVILAARERGARGVGIDLDPNRVNEARANARKAGVEHLVTFALQDVMEVDLSAANVVSLFLSPQANLMLRPKLQHQLPDNARIVSRSHDMGDWPPAKTKLVACDGALSRIHLWRIHGRSE